MFCYYCVVCLIGAVATLEPIPNFHGKSVIDSSHARWIYMTGGDEFSWEPTTEPGPRSRVASWADSQGNLWIFGGIGTDSEISSSAHLTNDLWLFNITTMKWNEVQKPSLNTLPHQKVPSVRRGSVICGVEGVVLVLYGGETIDKTLPEDTWIYDMKKNNWLPLHELPILKNNIIIPPGRSSPAYWCHADKIYMFGGLSREGALLRDMWMFSLRTLKWDQVAEFRNKMSPSGRSAATTWVRGKDMYLFGGATQSDNPDEILKSDLWKYSATERTWRLIHPGQNAGDRHGRILNRIESIPEPRKHAQGWNRALSNTLYLFGGEGRPTSHLSNGATLYKEIWVFDLVKRTWDKLSYYTEAVTSHSTNRSVSHVTIRTRGTCWTDQSGAFYTFGGLAYDSRNQLNLLNDIWVLVPPRTPLPAQLQGLSLDIIEYPKSSKYTPSGGFIFLICLLTIGGVVMVVGAMFCLRKMSDYPRNRPSKRFKAKYSKLDDQDDADDTHDFLLKDEEPEFRVINRVTVKS